MNSSHMRVSLKLCPALRVVCWPEQMSPRLRCQGPVLKPPQGLYSGPGRPWRFSIEHIDQIVAAHGQTHIGAGRRLRPHLMPGHGRGIEDIALHRVELPGIFETAADLADLYDPPFRRTGMHVAKGGMRIKGALRRAAADIALAGTALVVV